MKKQIKKLSLNKRTVSNLGSGEMNQRVGGDKTKGKGNTCTQCVTLNLACTVTCTYDTCSCGCY